MCVRAVPMPLPIHIQYVLLSRIHASMMQRYRIISVRIHTLPSQHCYQTECVHSHTN